VNLNPQQVQSLHAGEAVESTVDGLACVVLRKDVYEQVKRVLDEDLTPLATARVIREACAEDDAGDPALDLYQHFKRNP
jgi:hypothetical protein